MKTYRIAVVGATGMVGRKFLQVIEERKLQGEFTLFSSARSAGQELTLCGKTHKVEELTENSFDGNRFDIALFSAGGSTSAKFAPIAAKNGALVIDNSSQWRMDPDVPLVVPEVNPSEIFKAKKNIIANPNCSTIQAVVALKPLSDAYGLKRVVYSTYQAVSGAGLAGYNDLIEGVKGEPPKKFPHPIFHNVIPHIDVFLPNGYTKEEEKMILETRKILDLPELRVTATTVRVPVPTGHSESVNVEFEKEFDLAELKAALAKAPGIVVCDDDANFGYPMPIHAADRDEVFVGRIRRDDSVDSGVNLWVVSDNLRKGAASNAVQIAEAYIAGQK